MVATTDCAEKPKPVSGNKVSKPLMEKKRRARINRCLDQLKSLLESYYSSSIRKRKLEKADILELTVKHLKNLQKIQTCTAAASEFSDFHTGFRSCLANVNQYLLMSENVSGNDHWMLSRLSNRLCRSWRRGAGSSTMDSGLAHADAQAEERRLPPSAPGPEEANGAKSTALKLNTALLPSEDACQSSGAKQAPPQSTDDKSSRHKKCHSGSHRNEAANTQHSVWRPW